MSLVYADEPGFVAHVFAIAKRERSSFAAVELNIPGILRSFRCDVLAQQDIKKTKKKKTRQKQVLPPELCEQRVTAAAYLSE